MNWHHRGKNKYNNITVECDGYTFDSKRECLRYQQLKLMEKAGEITDLEVHPSYDVVINGEPVRYSVSKRPISIELDFLYFDKVKGQKVVEDVKGRDNAVSRIKRALFEHIYGIKVKLT